MANTAVDRRRNTNPRIGQALALVCAAWLVATPVSASVKGGWSDGAAKGQSFSRVLVVGVSSDRNQRCSFERTVASAMRSDATQVFISCDVLPADAELTRQSIEAAVSARQADAVLVTTLVATSWNAEEGGTHDTRGRAYYKATDAYFGPYGTVVAADFRTSAPITTVEGEAHIVSKLYETQGATVVYTVDAKVRDVGSSNEGIADVAAPIAKKLQREKLIR